MYAQNQCSRQGRGSLGFGATIQRTSGGGRFNTNMVPALTDLDLMLLSFLGVLLQAISFIHVNVVRFRSLDITSMVRSIVSLTSCSSFHVIAPQSFHLQNQKYWTIFQSHAQSQAWILVQKLSSALRLENVMNYAGHVKLCFEPYQLCCGSIVDVITTEIFT